MGYSNLPAYANNKYSALPFPAAQTCADPCACKMKVEGKWSVNARPDIAVVILSVITENKQLSIAQKENSENTAAVIKSLRENGIPPVDIQTQAYNITPQYDYVEGKQVFRGYRVEHSLKVTIRDMARIGKIIDDAVENGANQVSSIVFSVSNPAAYYQLALNAAVDDAARKAHTLANKLNIAVSKAPVQIIEMGYEAGTPVPMTYQTTGAVTPIQTGQIEISARIEAVFAYKPAY